MARQIVDRARIGKWHTVVTYDDGGVIIWESQTRIAFTAEEVDKLCDVLRSRASVITSARIHQNMEGWSELSETE